MKLLKYVILSTLTSLIVMTILGRFSGPWIEKSIQERLKTVCDSCEFHTSGVALLPSGFKLINVRFSAGDKEQKIEVKIPALEFHPDWITLFPGPIKINKIGLIDPQFTFIDSSQPSNKKTETTFLIPAMPPIHIANGKLNYIRDISGTHGELTIQKVNAKIEAKENVAHAEIIAQIGGQGHLDLTIDASTKSNNLALNIDMKAKNQDFKDLSRFFEPNAGVKLEGTLTAGHAISKISNRKVSTTLLAEFKDFKLEVNKMYDRNDIQTFFTNLAAKVGLKEKNVDKSKSDKIEAVDAEREPGESIISFILRSWKEAALKVAQ